MHKIEFGEEAVACPWLDQLRQENKCRMLCGVFRVVEPEDYNVPVLLMLLVLFYVFFCLCYLSCPCWEQQEQPSVLSSSRSSSTRGVRMSLLPSSFSFLACHYLEHQGTSHPNRAGTYKPMIRCLGYTYSYKWLPYTSKQDLIA